MNEYTKVGWQDGTVLQPAKVTIDGVDYEVTPAVESGTTPVNATNLDKMDTALKQSHDGVRNLQTNKIDKSTIELLTVDSVAPEHCSTGDMYYNTTTNFIYTATGTDTWGTTGETPSSKYLYVDLTNSKLYYYDGTNFTSYGGGSSNDVVISPDQPTGDDWKLWIDSDEVGSQASEITNEYSTSTGLGYSANYINNMSKVLWTNPDPTQNFGAQTITLNDNINNYTYYEVIYRVAKGGVSGSSSKVLISMAACMYYMINFMAKRTTSVPNDTSMVINEAYFNGSYGQGGSVNNELLIPVQVIGYK